MNRTRTLPSIVRLLALALASGFAHSALAQPADDWARAEEVVRAIRLPEIPARDYRITDFGAREGGAADARPAILAAIKKASAEGGGRVVIPPGNWLSRGPIHLASRINLHVSEGATLLFAPEARHYLPVVLTRWEGTEVYGYSPLIYAFEVKDVAVTGKGTIDGNAASEFLTWIPKAEPDFQRLRRMGSDGTPAAKRVFGEGTH
ncbi:MAG TPA: glycosyl hydrolase family 28-related protein, partial [Pyrinomonadaceae bacterium]|nr:glycosyl hydrolase family 28-related protein [Pyrinomonadaceae bacterium]